MVATWTRTYCLVAHAVLVHASKITQLSYFFQLCICVMSTLKDLLPLLAVHGILRHLLPRMLLPMALQAALRGLVV